MKRVFPIVIAILLVVALYPATAYASDAVSDDEILSLGESGEGDSEDDENDLEGEEVDLASALAVLADYLPLSIPEQNDYPPNSPLAGALYIQANTSQLGQVLIYIPVDYQRGSLTYDRNGNLVNIRSGTITGFMYRGNTLYNIYWSALQTPQYRLYSSGTYQALTVTSVTNTNVVLVEKNEDLPVVPTVELYQLILIYLLGVVAICLFMKRF